MPNVNAPKANDPAQNVQAVKAVDGVSASSVSDNPKTGTDTGTKLSASNPAVSPTAADKKDANLNPVQPTPNATNVPDGVISQLTEDEKEQNAAFEKALAEKDNVLTGDEQKRIDSALGEEPENMAFDSNDFPKTDNTLTGRLSAFCQAEGHPVKVITNLVRDIPSDTPDDYIIGGAGGHKLRLGHLRALVVGIKPVDE